jgi:2-amino-4-hydroxy-6-hydroxymethyldihydropteridine diphosphokinase
MGSNLDDPVAQITRACEAMARLPRTRWLVRSSLYLSRPLMNAPQPDYVNAVALIETHLDADALLTGLQAIEAAQGRVRGPERWSSRTIDLDLLLFGRNRFSTGRLTVPHPEILNREFVLYPLQEIEPDLVIPGLGPLRDHVLNRPLRGMQRLEEGAQ